jgi:predicted NBD/HSP70 family sugar kinase
LRNENNILRPKSVRGANSAAVLQLLREYGSLSRADLARHSSLSEGSVSRITSELIRRELVTENGAENSTGGRPGTRLRLSDRQVGIGIEIRRGETRVAGATLSGRLFDVSSIRTPSTPAETLKLVTRTVRSLADKYGRGRIAGVGVSVHGIVNSRTGTVELGNLRGWLRVPVQDCLQTSLGMAVQVDNNVRLAAIAEYNYGNLLDVRNSRCLLFTVVDEGVGIGLVLEGKLYYGPRDAAGEFGQMVIADNNYSEQVDRPGCLEKLASSTALCKHYDTLNTGRTRSRTSGNRARVRKICQLALAGDKTAQKALAKTSRYLGIGLANVIWGLDADAVVIDAAMNEAWAFVGPAIQDQFPKHSDIVTFRNLVLRPSSLGGDAAIMGAATLPFKHLFASDVFHVPGETEKHNLEHNGTP